jgi:ketosteroid isomerase-like protein
MAATRNSQIRESMMSIEQNKQVVRSWFDAVNRGDEDFILGLTTDDFQFKAMARQPEWMLYNWNRDEFVKVPSTMSKLMTSPIRLSIVDMTAEGDRVAVEAETDSQMLNGKRYNNGYHFVFKLRDGKFYEVREYSCSHLAQSCFGAVEPSNPEASRMAAE